MTLIKPKQIAATDGKSSDLASQLQAIGLSGQVPDVSSLPQSGSPFEIRFVQSQGQYYFWNSNLATPVWQPLNGGLMRGTSFPQTGLYSGMLFYRTDLEQLFVYNQTAQAWIQK